MTPTKRWFALLGAALAAGVTVAASAQAKGPAAQGEAGDKHPPAAEAKGKDKDKDKDKGKDAAKADDKHKGGAAKADDNGKGAGKADENKAKATGKADAPGQEKDKNVPPGQEKDKNVPPGQEKDKASGNAEMPPPPPGAPDETLRTPPNHRIGHGPAPNAKLREKWQQRRGDQMKRRRARLQELREAWGEAELLKPEVKEAIRVHEWRMVRLKRIRELAVQDPDGKDLVDKVDKLTDAEQLRFQRQMAKMKRGGSDVGILGDAGPAPVGSPPTDKKEPPSTAGKKEGAK